MVILKMPDFQLN